MRVTPTPLLCSAGVWEGKTWANDLVVGTTLFKCTRRVSAPALGGGRILPGGDSEALERGTWWESVRRRGKGEGGTPGPGRLGRVLGQ